MSDRLLKETSSQRLDGQVWVWNYPDSLNVPFRVILDEGLQLPKGYKVRFVIKSDIRENDIILDRYYEVLDESVFVVEVSVDEVSQLRIGRTYYGGFALYDTYGNFVRNIVSYLPIRIEKSVFSNVVF